ncbi:hypothetical protein [Haliangium sp.]|uniref:hypothetical protein n=1 Tax=Haliangium sp. TaxID=2663208 RepID=UPI003D0E57F9
MGTAVALLLAGTIAGACAGGGEARVGPTRSEPATVAPSRRAADADARVPAPPPPLSEAAARALLAERFRRTGLRIRADVPIERAGAYRLTVDGYDPDRRVGFEYIAEVERGVELEPSERAALAADASVRVLIVEATDAAGVEAAAERFLTELAPE